jgi:hypothetical protein
MRWLMDWYARREIDQGGVPLASAQSCRPYMVSSTSTPAYLYMTFGHNDIALTSLDCKHH